MAASEFAIWLLHRLTCGKNEPKKVLMKRMSRKLKNWNGIDFMDLDFTNYIYFKQNYYMAHF